MVVVVVVVRGSLSSGGVYHKGSFLAEPEDEGSSGTGRKVSGFGTEAWDTNRGLWWKSLEATGLWRHATNDAGGTIAIVIRTLRVKERKILIFWAC